MVAPPESGEHEEGERREHRQPLRAQQQAALVDAVGDDPAVGAEQEHREELQRGGEADGDARAR